MIFEIRWDVNARDCLRSLEREIANRIFQKIDALKHDPKRYLERLVGLDSYKLIIGDYRAIVDVNEKENLILVRFIGHRKNVYKRFLR